jgi:hypothetical protein
VSTVLARTHPVLGAVVQLTQPPDDITVPVISLLQRSSEFLPNLYRQA